MNELSLIYHDRPVLPGKELVHWVEHVMRSGGAPHLRSLALYVPWYQKMYLDLFALAVAVFYILKFTVTKLCCSKKTTTTTSKNVKLVNKSNKKKNN